MCVCFCFDDSLLSVTRAGVCYKQLIIVFVATGSPNSRTRTPSGTLGRSVSSLLLVAVCSNVDQVVTHFPRSLFRFTFRCLLPVSIILSNWFSKPKTMCFLRHFGALSLFVAARQHVNYWFDSTSYRVAKLPPSHTFSLAAFSQRTFRCLLQVVISVCFASTGSPSPRPCASSGISVL